MTIALIDGDIIAYRCSASIEPNKSTKPEREPLDLAILRADELLYRIIGSVQSTEHRIFISGGSNFRKTLYPGYKANRDKLIRPVALESVREFLVREWGAEVCAGYEADDGIGIAATADSVICSIDKDLRQIPGEHFNFVKDEFETVDPYSAALAFWTQMLVGDASDNVPGISGIGPVKAARALVGLSPEEMEATTRNLYGDPEWFSLNWRLLKVIRSEEEWNEIEATIRKSEGEEPTEDGSSSNPNSIPDTNKE